VISFYDSKEPSRCSILFIGSMAVLVATGHLGIRLAPHAKTRPSPRPSLTLAASATEAEDTGGRIRTDRRVYAEPPLTPLPPAGGKFNDPVFGTEIMRATDAKDSPSPGCGTFYNQWPTFNSDNTRLLIRCGNSGDVKVKAFDPINFRLGATLRTSPTLPGGVTLTWEGATWSRVDPDLIFVHVNYYSPDYPATGMKLYSYRPSTNTFTLLKDFAPQLAPGQPDYLFEMHVAQDGHDDVFTFQHKRVGNSDALYFIVWKRSTDSVLLHIATDDSRLFPIVGTNACLPDKSGRWVYFSPNGSPTAGQARIRILDLTSSSWQTIYWAGEDDSPSHGDLGSGTLLGHGNFSGGAVGRSLSDVHHHTMFFDYKDAKGMTDWSQDQHMTLYADDESWAMMALYPEGGPYNTGAFSAEVMQFAMDGSQRIRRLFHHRSIIDNLTNTSGYWAIPKPTISRDGRFITFTSNWGKSGRYDLFIAKIDPAPRLSGLSQKRPAAPSDLVRQRRVTKTRLASRPPHSEN